MSVTPSPSIFREYYSPPAFVDRFANDSTDAVDVIIPIIHTNELWESNLRSIYREIPVRRLLLGDGGCIDDSLTIAKRFPRVEIFDHKKTVSLGFSVRKLIEEVRSEWFIYLHSDVYLPAGWFEAMRKRQSDFDWFECRQHITALVQYPFDYTNYERPLSGSQMGKTTAFRDILPKIDDDYLYRNEDLIFVELIREHGLRYGRVDEAFHYHQMMNKRSSWKRMFKRVTFEIEKSREEEIRENEMSFRGLIKYTQPHNQLLISSMRAALVALDQIQPINMEELRAWTKTTNTAWLPYLKKGPSMRERLGGYAARLARRLFRL